MKSEERHELQENALASWLATFIEQSRPYIKLVSGLLILGGAIWIGISTLRARSQSRQSAGWSDIFLARETADLETAASRFEGTTAGLWATQRVADMHMRSGSLELLRDFKKSDEQFTEARDGYQRVLDQIGERGLEANRDLGQRAYFGLAQCNESLRNYEEATKLYGLIIEKWPTSYVAELAADRKRLLEKPGTREFTDWYLQQRPPLSEANQASAAGNGTLPQTPLDTTLPSQPNIDLPTVFGGGTESSTTSAPDTVPSAEVPLSPTP